MITGKILINSIPERSLCLVRKTETFFERSKGLLGCKYLKEGHGMLIKPCNSIHTFFMRIPLDIVFLGKDNCIISMRENMKAQRFSMSRSAASVLELMAGQIYLSGLQKGDQLQWEPLQ